MGMCNFIYHIYVDRHLTPAQTVENASKIHSDRNKVLTGGTSAGANLVRKVNIDLFQPTDRSIYRQQS